MKSTPRRRFESWLLFLVSLPSIGLGCGIDWSLPAHHFSGVSPQGYVDLWEKIGELDLGDELKLPLHIEFESSRESSSSLLGKGWFFPLLESCIVQEDENTFKVYQPDGRFRYFWRDKHDPSILNGQGGWKAEIANNTITTWADCGLKLAYIKGKLISMATDKGRLFYWDYGAGGTVERIREKNNTILEVTRNQVTGQIDGLLTFDKKKINIERCQAPRIQVINGQNVIGGMADSLAKLIFSDGTSKTYGYGVNQKLEPTLTIDNDRIFIWNPENKKIIGDGNWGYKINPGNNIYSNASIERINILNNQREFWYANDASGEKTVIDLSGRKTVISKFSSGILNGKPRKMSVISDAVDINITFTYDERGNLLRQTVKEIKNNDITAQNVYNQIRAVFSNDESMASSDTLRGNALFELISSCRKGHVSFGENDLKPQVFSCLLKSGKSVAEVKYGSGKIPEEIKIEFFDEKENIVRKMYGKAPFEDIKVRDFYNCEGLMIALNYQVKIK